MRAIPVRVARGWPLQGSKAQRSSNTFCGAAAGVDTAALTSGAVSWLGGEILLTWFGFSGSSVAFASAQVRQSGQEPERRSRHPKDRFQARSLAGHKSRPQSERGGAAELHAFSLLLVYGSPQQFLGIVCVANYWFWQNISNSPHTGLNFAHFKPARQFLRRTIDIISGVGIDFGGGGEEVVAPLIS